MLCNKLEEWDGGGVGGRECVCVCGHIYMWLILLVVLRNTEPQSYSNNNLSIQNYWLKMIHYFSQLVDGTLDGTQLGSSAPCVAAEGDLIKSCDGLSASMVLHMNHEHLVSWVSLECGCGL